MGLRIYIPSFPSNLLICSAFPDSVRTLYTMYLTPSSETAMRSSAVAVSSDCWSTLSINSFVLFLSRSHWVVAIALGITIAQRVCTSMSIVGMTYKPGSCSSSQGIKVNALWLLAYEFQQKLCENLTIPKDVMIASEVHKTL